MSKRIRVRLLKGKQETWAVREDAPDSGWIADVLCYCFPTKYQAGAVYDVVCLCLYWNKLNAEFVDPILESLRGQLKRHGCQLRDEWEDNCDRYEVWWRPVYSSHDIARQTLPAIAKTLNWTKVSTGYWPKEITQ